VRLNLPPQLPGGPGLATLGVPGWTPAAAAHQYKVNHDTQHGTHHQEVLQALHRQWGHENWAYATAVAQHGSRALCMSLGHPRATCVAAAMHEGTAWHAIALLLQVCCCWHAVAVAQAPPMLKPLRPGPADRPVPSALTKASLSVHSCMNSSLRSVPCGVPASPASSKT
jgi:hypothetical protein